MAEAEDVIQDAARHATTHIRRLWLKHYGPADAPKKLSLADVRQRIDLLVYGVYGLNLPVKVAQVPAPPTLLLRLFRRYDVRQSGQALPCTDGRSIWLPMELPLDITPQTEEADRASAAELFRTIALLQACRAMRGSADYVNQAACPRCLALYIVLEARAADEQLLQELPGMAASILRLRKWMLERRPPVSQIPPASQLVEVVVRDILSTPLGEPAPGLPWPPSAHAGEHLEVASWLLRQRSRETGATPHRHALFKDCWTGDLLPSAVQTLSETAAPYAADAEYASPPRSARMPRSPKEMLSDDEEEKKEDGTWMIQTAEPHEKAEDPMGTQRPIDRDEDTASEEFADALSELPEARVVSDPTPAKEILLSDDAPARHSTFLPAPAAQAMQTFSYPEWDCRLGGYRLPGTTVHLLSPQYGPEIWVAKTLARHRSMLDTIRRRFEMLQADRVRLRRRLDGDEIDIDAYTEARCDLSSGQAMPQALYQQQRRQMRNIAIMLLVDVSGSTDSYLTEHRRIIDVEREALLLVAIALQHMGEPYSIQAFSGEGPDRVTISTLKDFKESHSQDVSLRIASLEPQYYTRTGAALRHATTMLMQQPAQHRLLMLLSDGKPNDVDVYEGRYGVEDTRRAVEEARIQGVHPFCLTIDRQAAGYLPQIFGHGQYALLARPAELPRVLLDWMRRLVART